MCKHSCAGHIIFSIYILSKLSGTHVIILKKYMKREITLFDFFFLDCKNLLKKLLEPSSDLRLPLLDVEIHPWVTQGVKSSFHTFHKYPKDKTMKSQVSSCSSKSVKKNSE